MKKPLLLTGGSDYGSYCFGILNQVRRQALSSLSRLQLQSHVLGGFGLALRRGSTP